MKARIKISKVFVVFAALFAFSACNYFKPVTKEQYSKDGLTFTHFSNWEITGDSTTGEDGVEVRIINVEGPDNSILTASRFPSIVDITIEEYVRMMSQEMKNSAKDLTGGIEVVSMNDGKTTPSEAQVNGVTRQGLAREFDVKALGTPILHHAEYYMVENDQEKWFIVMQSSKEDWNGVRDGFQTILDTFPIAETKAQGAGKSK